MTFGLTRSEVSAISGEEHELKLFRCELFGLFQSFWPTVLGEAEWRRGGACDTHTGPHTLSVLTSSTSATRPPSLSPRGRTSCKTNTLGLKGIIKENKLVLSGDEIWH